MFKDNIDKYDNVRKGKHLAYKITCKACDASWINMLEMTFNVGCIKCFNKQTQKKLQRIWITIEPCTEFENMGDIIEE